MSIQNTQSQNPETIINKLNELFNDNKVPTELEKFETAIYTVIFNKENLENILNNQGVQIYFTIGINLLQTFEKSKSNLKQRIRTILLNFLDFARTNLLLQEVYRQERGDEWLSLLLSIVEKTNFTTGQLFSQRVQNYSVKPLFKVIKNKNITEYSWMEIHEKVYEIACALLAFSAGKESPGPVGILSENCIEMACIDLACLITGIVNVPIPANSVASQVEYIAQHSEVKIIFISTENQLNKVLSCRTNLPNLQHIILIHASEDVLNDDYKSFNGFLAQGQNVGFKQVQMAVNNVKIHDLATIMYTSGTTESPKGIMFSQYNIVSKRFARAIALPEIGDQDVFLCYLPLFHTFGRYLEMLGCIFWGSTYIFLESPKIEILIENFQLVRPTVFISIPQKWFQLFEKIQDKIDIAVAPHAEIQQAVSTITGGCLKWGLSAAGYLDPDIFRLFQKYGIELMSGFGMTEATGGITMTPPFQYHENSVGKALPGVEIKLADDGEMIIFGPYIMVGYFKTESSNFKDGWLYTGDIFLKDAKGFFQIIDRKKEIYKSSKGETIAPQKIENLFRDFESVQHVFLVGDHRAYNTLLLYPNYEYDQINLVDMNRDELRDFYNSLVVTVNRFLAPYERIADFTIVDRDFDASKGELTQKGTYKRKIVENNFNVVIEKMYSKDYAAYVVGNFEIRIDNWFLREKGLTPDDVKLEKSALFMKPTKAKLSVEASSKQPGMIRLGSFWYSTERNFLDLRELISNPKLWLGNIPLQKFVGEEIFRWTHLRQDKYSDLTIITKKCPRIYIGTISSRFKQNIEENVNTLQNIHYSAYFIQTQNQSLEFQAMDYLESVIKTNKEGLAKLAKEVLLRTSQCKDLFIKKLAFQILILNKKGEQVKTIFETFLITDEQILDEKIISDICDLDIMKNHITDIFSLLKCYTTPVHWQNYKTTKNFVVSLLNLITTYGNLHPVWYKSIRAELVKWSLCKESKEVASHANRCMDKLLMNFRQWLGSNQKIAVDTETHEEYRWGDVITFEEGIAPEDKAKMFNAIETIPLIREAIFLFSRGTLVRLQDLPHYGIWISFLGSLHGKTVYRVTVQTHHHGAFDLAININHTLSEIDVTAEITWLICAGASEGKQPLAEDFGGYWPEYNLWTEEFIPGDTVEQFVKRLDRHPEDELIDRIQQIWPYFAWSGLSAYIDFWNRTGRQLEIADPKPANVIVPSHDYQVGFRIISISERKPFLSTADMILSFRKYFIDAVESQYNKLRGKCSWHVIFSSFLEVLGEKEGIKILEETLESFKNKTLDEDSSIIQQKLNTFIKTVHEKGYLPKRLHFAIQRYSRWIKLNPTATVQARNQTLQDLFTTYDLENLEKEYPGTRIQFFRDTIYAQSDVRILDGLNHILQKIKSRQLSEKALPEKMSELRSRVTFSKEEELFFTRMTYPHLSPQASAQLISLTADGTHKTDLVVFIEDHDGNKLRIRHPVSPKEIAKLHRLFRFTNLPVDFRPHHQYLVILDERMQVIGGLFYSQTDDSTVHLEKVVVAERQRKKGVSDGLMNEFFNRLRNQGIKIVTVGFFRPEYFYKFGFKIDHQFGNMVKTIESVIRKDSVDELVEMKVIK